MSTTTPPPPPAVRPSATSPDGATPVAAVPRWAIHRRLYDWTLSLAYHRHSTTALFFLSMAESSFFPIPPDVLQAAMTLERRERAWWYATVSTVGSVIGALVGYLVGWLLWSAMSGFFFRFVFTEEVFQKVVGLYDEHAFMAVFLAAFTPIPFKVFTVAAGVCAISIPALLIASVIGRGARFFLVALLIWSFGPIVKRFLDKQFNLACLVFGVLLVGGFMAVKYLR